MSESPGPLVLGLSIHGTGELQVIASDVAGKLAQYAGGGAAVETALSEAVSRLVREIGAPNGDHDIALEFRSEGGEAIVAARCGTRRSEVRFPLAG